MGRPASALAPRRSWAPWFLRSGWTAVPAAERAEATGLQRSCREVPWVVVEEPYEAVEHPDDDRLILSVPSDSVPSDSVPSDSVPSYRCLDGYENRSCDDRTLNEN